MLSRGFAIDDGCERDISSQDGAGSGLTDPSRRHFSEHLGRHRFAEVTIDAGN
jgi:hypothetical protein